VLQELLKIFRGDDPLRAIADNFSRMLELARDNILLAGEIYFERKPGPAERSQVYRQDIEINKLQRAIRKQVATRLSVTSYKHDLPYCLVMMSLVKDVERLGDYAKNLVDIVDIHPDPFAEDELFAELREIRIEVEGVLRAAHEVLVNVDREKAMEHIRSGKDLARRCDAMLAKIAQSDASARTATALALGARYYKRVGGHLLNVISSVVMPLHKLDYFDEDEIREYQLDTAADQ